MPKKQIGGSHYKNKGGIQDLQKIIHYCEMEIDFMKKKFQTIQLKKKKSGQQ